MPKRVAAGEAGAAGGDDGIDAGVGDPSLDDGTDRIDVVGDDLARGEMMACRGRGSAEPASPARDAAEPYRASGLVP